MKWEAFSLYDKRWRRDFYRIQAVRRLVNRSGKSKQWAIEALNARAPKYDARALVETWESAGDFDRFPIGKIAVMAGGDRVFIFAEGDCDEAFEGECQRTGECSALWDRNRIAWFDDPKPHERQAG